MLLGPIVYTAATAALFILAIAFLLAGWRVIAGPTLADRVLALDTLSGIAIGFIAVVAVKTGFTLYIDIAIALGLVGFLATVAFARFMLSQGGTYGSNQSGRYERKPEPSGKRAGRRKGKGGKS